MKKDKTLNEVSRKLLGRYIDRITAQPGMEKGDPRQRSYSKRQKNAAGLERAFNKSSPYGKSGSNPVKVSATESVVDETFAKAGGNGPHSKWTVTLKNGKTKTVHAANRAGIKDRLSPEHLIIGIKSAVKHQNEETELTEMQGDDYNQAGWNHDPYDYNKGKWTQVKKILTNKEAAKSASKIANRIAKQIAQKKVKEEVEQTNEWVVPIQPQRIIKRTKEEKIKRAENKAEKYLHMPGKNAAKSRQYWAKKVNKLHGIPEEVELDENRDAEYMKMHGMTHSEFHKLPQAERIKLALSAVNKSFSTPPEGHKDAKPAPVKKPEPKQGAGMPFYPENSGRRNMGDSVEMNGETISEAKDGLLFSVYISHPKGTGEKMRKLIRVTGTKDERAGGAHAQNHFTNQGFKVHKVTKLMDEEVERVNEVSKKKLKNYITKATDDKISAHSHDYRYHDFYDEEPDRDHDQDSKDYARAEKREKGIDLARAKVNKSGKSGRAIAKVKANEEVERVDELSKATVDSYSDKARMDRNDVLGIALRKYSSPEEKAKYKAIADKRGRGQMIAQAKLRPDGIYRYSDRTIAKQAKVVATEEVEQIDELSKDTLASYNRKAWDDRQAIGRKLPDLAKKSTLYRGKTYTKDERDTAEKAHNQAQKLSHKYSQRTKGIETSEKKWMAKEEVEVMNEEVSTKPDGRFPGRHHVFWKGNKLNVRIQNADAGTGSGGRSNNRYRNHFLEYVAPDGINTTKRIRVGTLGDAKRLVTNLMKKRDALRAGETVKESAYGMEKAVEAGRKERIQRRIRDRQVIHHQNTAVHKAAEKFTKKTD